MSTVEVYARQGPCSKCQMKLRGPRAPVKVRSVKATTFSAVNRFSVWLSARQIRRYTGPLAGKGIGDIGCGYNAGLVRSVSPEVDHALLADLSLSPELKIILKITHSEMERVHMRKKFVIR